MSQLTKSSLVSRSSVNKALSVHRLVQAAVFNRLPKADILLYLDFSITLLSNGFPNTWDKTGHHQGHGWASWETCSEVLPHVGFLMDLVQKYKLSPSRHETFAELIFRSGS